MSFNEMRFPLAELDAGQPNNTVATPPVYAWFYHGLPPDGPNSCKPAVKLTEPGPGWAVREPLIRQRDHLAIVATKDAQLQALGDNQPLTAFEVARQALEAACQERHPNWDNPRYFGEIAKQHRRVELAREIAAAPLPAVGPDACSACSGQRGGVPGNENIVNGCMLCDYCHAEVMVKT